MATSCSAIITAERDDYISASITAERDDYILGLAMHHGGA